MPLDTVSRSRYKLPLVVLLTRFSLAGNLSKGRQVTGLASTRPVASFWGRLVAVSNFPICKRANAN